MSPRHRSSAPSFRDRYRLPRRPSRLTLGVAAATVAAVAGVSAVVSAGAGAPVGGASSLAEISHPPAHAHARRAGGRSGSAPSRQAAPGQVPAHRPHHPPVHAAAKPAAPYLIYDSVLPTAIPANSMVATYATGPYAASPSQVAGRQVMWIDVYGTDYEASALDVEPSDATPDQAASWAYHRLSLHPHALAHIYTNISEWPQVQAACASLPAWMRSHIRWWIADPTGVAHIVPGSDATQWYWGSSYDISTATPRF